MTAPQTPEIDASLCAWAAGLIDGEGCITIRRDKATEKSRHATTHFALLLKVSMVHRPTIERLHDIFGVGHVKHSPPPTKRTRPAWHWCCLSNEALAVIRAVRPYLFLKAKEADLAERFMGLGDWRRGKQQVPQHIIVQKDWFYWEMREAKTFVYHPGESKPKFSAMERS